MRGYGSFLRSIRKSGRLKDKAVNYDECALAAGRAKEVFANERAGRIV